MKIFKQYVKRISTLLMVLVLFQSCTIYKRANVTLDKTIDSKIKTRITNINGRKYNFKHVVFEDNDYYGVAKSHGEIVKTKLSEKSIEKVQLKDKTGSTILTILLPITILVGGILILADAFKFTDSDSEGGSIPF